METPRYGIGLLIDNKPSDNNELYLSVAEAIVIQNRVHYRLMHEIDDGLKAEAEYLKYYDFYGELTNDICEKL